MKMNNGNATDFLHRYWLEGFNVGLLSADAAVIVICTLDVVRFMWSGGSLVSAGRVGTEMAMRGQTIGLGVAVLIFHILAIPMVLALFSAFLAPRRLWPQILVGTPKYVLEIHLLISSCLAMFTTLAISMELLSGYAKDEHGIGYSFGSVWLGAVFLGKPVYVAYISPIIRKFIIRFSADPTKAGHKLDEVIKEVGTEESLGERG